MCAHLAGPYQPATTHEPCWRHYPRPVPRDVSTPAESDRDLAGGVRTVSGLTLASRALGLVRDLVLVRVFGDTIVGSAFTAAFAIPNLFRRLFGEGALAAAFLPEYARLEDGERQAALARITLLGVGAVTGLLMVLIEVALLLVLVLTPTDESRDLSLRLIMLLLPFMPLICTAAILGAILQARGRFGPAAAAPIVLNLFIIAAALLHFVGPELDARRSAFAVGIATVLAGIAQVAWCLISLGRAHALVGPITPALAEGRLVLRRFGPVVIGMGAIQINALLDQLIAMWPAWVGPTIAGIDYPLDVRSNAILGFTQRLYQFPLGVFGIAVATVAFPMLSRVAQGPQFAVVLAKAIRLSLFIGLPASVGLVLVRDDLVEVMFGGPSGFSDDGLVRSQAVLLGYASAVWIFSLNHVLVRAFYAMGDTTTPMRVAIGTVLVNLGLNIALIFPFGEAGLAWATSGSQLAQFVVLSLMLRRRGSLLLSAQDRAGMVRIVLASCAVVPAVLVVHAMTAREGWGDHLVSLMIACSVGVLVDAVAARLLRLKELGMLVRRAAPKELES